jgi:hypothetical protein
VRAGDRRRTDWLRPRKIQLPPELNGVASLFVLALRGRIGLLNPALFQIETSPDAYRGRHAAFRDITQGSNWCWNAGPGYDRATGVGVPHVANLPQALSALMNHKGESRLAG